MHQLLWVRPFSGMRTTVIVAAMLVEQLELFPPLITIGNRMLPQPMRWVRFASAGRTFCPVATPNVWARFATAKKEDRMGTGSYTGGHTKIYITDNGTKWEVLDRSAEQADRSRREGWDEEIIGRSERTVSKEARSFLSICATAFRGDSLTENHPMPPVALRKQIRRAGGNKKWIATDQIRLSLFESFYKKTKPKP